MTLNLDFLNCIQEPIICIVDDEKIEFENGNAAKEFYEQDSAVVQAQSITVKNGILTITLNKENCSDGMPRYSLDEEWVQNYIRDFGTEPSFF